MHNFGKALKKWNPESEKEKNKYEECRGEARKKKMARGVFARQYFQCRRYSTLSNKSAHEE
jgi:hypothetical protein